MYNAADNHRLEYINPGESEAGDSADGSEIQIERQNTVCLRA
jgi:hypothetical protein